MNFFKRWLQPKEGWDGPLPEMEEPIEIVDIIDDLAHHPTRTWTHRDLLHIDSLVVHQAVGEYEITGIAKYHVKPGAGNHISKKGAPGLCYHIAIDLKGNVFQTNKLTDVVWHGGSRKWNNKAIGVLLVGNFEGPTHTPPEKTKHKNPTNMQLASLRKLLKLLTKEYDIKKDMVFGHCDIKESKVNCPGKVAMITLDNFRGN